MIYKIRHLAIDIKYVAVSFVSVLPALLFHLVHWLSAPLLIGAAEASGHHHGATGTGESAAWIGIVLPAIMLLNLISMGAALWQLRQAWKDKRRSSHVYACCAVSILVLAFGAYSFASFAG